MDTQLLHYSELTLKASFHHTPILVRKALDAVGSGYVTARDFVNRWNEQAPAHHCAVGLGHIGGKLEKLAELLGLETKRIC